MTPLEKFLVVNHLKQADIIEFLKLSKSTISQAVSGKSQLSKIKLFELIENDRGWDASMLSAPVNITQSIGDGSSNNTQVACDQNITALQKEIEMLREQLTALQKEKEEYWQLIKRLTDMFNN